MHCTTIRGTIHANYNLYNIYGSPDSHNYRCTPDLSKGIVATKKPISYLRKRNVKSYNSNISSIIFSVTNPNKER